MTTVPMMTPRLRGVRRTLRLVAAPVVLALVATIVPVLGAHDARAASTTSGWLAAQVAPDGSVIDPYSSTPSVDWSVNIASALVLAQDQTDALERAMGYIERNADTYLSDATSDVAGHLSWLILLAVGTGRDPRSFGASSIDLVSLLESRFGIGEAGLYGAVDAYTPVTNQSLAIMALIAAGREVPTQAIEWLLRQQCLPPADSFGAWQGHRAQTGGVVDDCLRSTLFERFDRPETGSTSFAIMALSAVAEDLAHRGLDTTEITASIVVGTTWLLTQRVTDGEAAGGWGQYPGEWADPNSTGVVMMALRATGADPAGDPWTLPGGTNGVTSLAHWVIAAGPDVGAYASPYSGGDADLFATFQSLWGVSGRSFPYLVDAELTPPPVEPAPPATDESPIAMTPVFTG